MKRLYISLLIWNAGNKVHIYHGLQRTQHNHTQKTALVPNKQKQERTHKKLQLSSTFTCVTCSTKSPDVNWGKVAPCTQVHKVAHNLNTSCAQVVHSSYKSWSQAAHKVAHTPWCASWSQVARYSVSFPFQAVALGDSSTDLALTHTIHKNSPTNTGGGRNTRIYL